MLEMADSADPAALLTALSAPLIAPCTPVAHPEHAAGWRSLQDHVIQETLGQDLLC